MLKGSGHPATSELLAGDWFLPAITCDGTVADSLTSVQSELSRKSAFARGLQHNLTSEGTAVDRVTELMQRVKMLETTLRFRLGILLPERPQAWFRSPAATSTGPFQTTLIGEPIFAPYAAADVDAALSSRTIISVKANAHFTIVDLIPNPSIFLHYWHYAVRFY